MKTKPIIVTILLLLAIANTLKAVFPTTPLSGGGTGTVVNPYIITTADDLIQVRNAVNTANGSGVATASYKLSANIDMSAQGDWTGLGALNNPFKGVFSGNGFKITGLKMGAASVSYNGAVASDPVFIYSDNASNLTTLFDVSQRIAAIPASVRPYAWLAIYQPLQYDYYTTVGGVDTPLTPPTVRPTYAAEQALFIAALEKAKASGVKVIIQLVTGKGNLLYTYGVNSGTTTEIAYYDNLLATYPCIAALETVETGSWQALNANTTNHIINFTNLCSKYNRKFVWTSFIGTPIDLWNNLMTDVTLSAFIQANSNTIIPVWKNVEPADNMLNWGDCVGLWLSGYTNAWGFKFDTWYYSNYIPMTNGTTRSYYSTIGTGMDGIGLYGCPSYLVKDNMILSVLTGSNYFSTEPNGVYDYVSPQGPLRGVIDNVYQLIVANLLVRSKSDVMALCKVAVESPTQSAIGSKGFTHSTTTATRPNILWKQVFAIPDSGLDIIPNDGKNFIVPVVPPTGSTATFTKLLTATSASSAAALSSTLTSYYPRRFIASDPNVLVFDAGKYIYITDSREDNRTLLQFTLQSTVAFNYNLILLTADGTVKTGVKPTQTASGAGWSINLLLPVGCSILLTQQI